MSQKSKFSQSIGDLIVATLLSNKNSAQFRKILYEREFARYKKESIRMTFSRLHKKGYLENNKGNWSLTKKGKMNNSKNILFSFIPSPFKKNQQPNIIVSFDITEADRVKRNWLRNQLKVFNYKMLQQSLWLGPGPLPPEFLKRLYNLGIRENIKIFRIKEKDI